MESIRISTNTTAPILAAAAILVGSSLLPAQAQITRRVSETADGVGGDQDSKQPSISADGDVVVFASQSNNLGGLSHTYGVLNVFRYDRASGETTAVTTFDLGDPGWGPSYAPDVSEDGAWIAFESGARLDGDPLWGGAGIYVTQTGGSFVRLDVPVWGTGSGGSSDPVLSADGRHVAFESHATTLVPEGIDVNGGKDVFVVDRDPDGNGVFDEGNSITTLVSATPAGFSGNAASRRCSISGSGRYVAFESEATDLGRPPVGWPYCNYVRDRDPDGNGDFYDVPGVTTQVNLDETGAWLGSVLFAPQISSDGSAVAMSINGQIYVKDRVTGAVELVSKSSLGEEGNSTSRSPAISADGNRVAFESLATNLVWNNSPALGINQVYLHDRTTGQTTRLSVDSAGHPSNGYTGVTSEISYLDLSDDGTTTAFTNQGDNLVVLDVNDKADVFQHEICPNPAVDLGQAKAGGGGLFPEFTVCGNLATGDSAELRLRNAAPRRPAVLLVDWAGVPWTSFCGGAGLRAAPPMRLSVLTDELGDVTVQVPGGGGPRDLYALWLVRDPQASCGYSLSNVLRVSFER